MSAHCWGPVLICIHRLKRPRMRRRRLYTTSNDPRRPRGDLRTTNRLDSLARPTTLARQKLTCADIGLEDGDQLEAENVQDAVAARDE